MISHDSRLARWIKVQAYKHDGKLHRQWSPAYLVSETPDYYAICSKASCVTESDGRKWITKEHAAFILFKKRWMNVIAMFKKDWGICYYVNIASPTIKDHGMLKYIDYDLDVKLYPDGAEKTLDINEYACHAASYGYSKELSRAIEKSMDEVKGMIARREFPFVDEDIKALYDRFLAENKPFKKKEGQ
ncbi:MAG TPA: DUF402 domain-containing protein [Candidatus Enteromonas pullicola]|uniref:DUF402 domain-containing protein n=1 Tax=Candidatus Alloenteromonas pullicola TaxID=2840784 RepID=A0A9D1LNL9_9FIRM|nr:DUF402 domain-containing protein [Candidatus Enteromonas pullicola]